MSDLPSAPEPRPPGAPRWVKLFGIVAVAIVAIVVIVALFGGGEHGPGRHLPGGDDRGNHAPPMEHDS